LKELDPLRIQRELQRLRSISPTARIFGAESHKFLLNPTLAEAEVANFERQHKISLPADYRNFLTGAGNGGAGPYYGIFPLGQSSCSNSVFILWYSSSANALSMERFVLGQCRTFRRRSHSVPNLQRSAALQRRPGRGIHSQAITARTRARKSPSTLALDCSRGATQTPSRLRQSPGPLPKILSTNSSTKSSLKCAYSRRMHESAESAKLSQSPVFMRLRRTCCICLHPSGLSFPSWMSPVRSRSPAPSFQSLSEWLIDEVCSVNQT
jgi:hypothetical protein